MTYFEKGKDILSQIPYDDLITTIDLSDIYNSIGICYKYLNQFENAIVNYEEGIKLRENYEGKDS